MNEDQIVILVLGALLNGATLAIGMWIGTRQSAKAIVKEVEKVLEKNELIKTLKKTLTDQTLLVKATKFFEEATTLVSSVEAKNFFKNATEALKEFSSSESDIKVNLPKKPEEMK